MKESWKPYSPDELLSQLEFADFPWWISGGWGLDLWIGHVTRLHEDIDITVFREHLPGLFRALEGHEFFLADRGQLIPIAGPEDVQRNHWNFWVRRKGDSHWRLQVMLADQMDGRWIYRRNHSIQLEASSIGEFRHGYPLLRPEVQLLFKSNLFLEKDARDFESTVPHLWGQQREWLADALGKAYPEKHPWGAQLTH